MDFLGKYNQLTVRDSALPISSKVESPLIGSFSISGRDSDMNEQRKETLRRMLEQVDAASLSNRTKGETLESLSTGDQGELLESAGPGSVAQQELSFAQESLDAFATGSDFDSSQQFMLEAIILPFKRPVIDVVQNEMAAGQLTAQWKHLATDGRKKATIETALLSIGRIEVPSHNLLPYAGTGFVVGPDLIMTNRHVAGIFAQGLGQRNLQFISGQTSKIDFLQEVGNNASDSLQVTEIVMIHPYWDMAILRVSGLSPIRKPLKLSTNDPATMLDTDVVTIGYPGFTPSSDSEFQRVQSRVFRDVYYVKRIQPGKLKTHSNVVSFQKTVRAITHDCSTLGGNSGSAVIDVNTGSVLGLHFAGAYLHANYAVPANELAADKRIVDAGVQFTSSPQPQEGLHKSFWDAAASENVADQATASNDASSSSQLSAVSNQSSPPSQGADGSLSNSSTTHFSTQTANWTLPLVITVDIGKPQMSSNVLDSDNYAQSVATNPPTTSSNPQASIDRQKVEGLFGPPPEVFSLTELKELYSSQSLTKNSFHMSTALSMAAASKFVYENGEVIKPFGKGGFGFDTCKFIEASDTQCFIASTKKAVIISFRGTESVGDWLLNLRVLTTSRPYGKVHTGFLRGFEFVQMQLESELAKLSDRRILITGHSLGGALATVAAAQWEGQFDISGVYTFGQPGVGFSSFASFINKKYKDKFFRFVNNSDVVTKVPPGFSHAGRLFHFDKNGTVKADTESLGGTSSEMMSESKFAEFQNSIERVTHASQNESLAIQESLFTSVSDHRMDRYIEKIRGNEHKF